MPPQAIRGPFTTPSSSTLKPDSTIPVTAKRRLISIGPPIPPEEPLRVYTYGVRDWKIVRLKMEGGVNLPGDEGGGGDGGEKHELRREEKQEEEEEKILHEEKVESKWTDGRKVILRLGRGGADLTLYETTTSSNSTAKQNEPEKEKEGVKAEEVRKELGKVVGMHLDPAEEENGTLLWSVRAGEMIGAQTEVLENLSPTLQRVLIHLLYVIPSCTTSSLSPSFSLPDPPFPLSLPQTSSHPSQTPPFNKPQHRRITLSLDLRTSSSFTPELFHWSVGRMNYWGGLGRKLPGSRLKGAGGLKKEEGGEGWTVRRSNYVPIPIQSGPPPPQILPSIAVAVGAVVLNRTRSNPSDTKGRMKVEVMKKEKDPDRIQRKKKIAGTTATSGGKMIRQEQEIVEVERERKRGEEGVESIDGIKVGEIQGEVQEVGSVVSVGDEEEKGGTTRLFDLREEGEESPREFDVRIETSDVDDDDPGGSEFEGEEFGKTSLGKANERVRGKGKEKEKVQVRKRGRAMGARSRAKSMRALQGMETSESESWEGESEEESDRPLVKRFKKQLPTTASGSKLNLPSSVATLNDSRSTRRSPIKNLPTTQSNSKSQSISQKQQPPQPHPQPNPPPHQPVKSKANAKTTLQSLSLSLSQHINSLAVMKAREAKQDEIIEELKRSYENLCEEMRGMRELMRRGGLLKMTGSEMGGSGIGLISEDQGEGDASEIREEDAVGGGTTGNHSTRPPSFSSSSQSQTKKSRLSSNTPATSSFLPHQNQNQNQNFSLVISSIGSSGSTSGSGTRLKQQAISKLPSNGNGKYSLDLAKVIPPSFSGSTGLSTLASNSHSISDLSGAVQFVEEREGAEGPYSRVVEVAPTPTTFGSTTKLPNSGSVESEEAEKASGDMDGREDRMEVEQEVYVEMGMDVDAERSRKEARGELASTTAFLPSTSTSTFASTFDHLNPIPPSFEAIESDTEANESRLSTPILFTSTPHQKQSHTQTSPDIELTSSDEVTEDTSFAMPPALFTISPQYEFEEEEVDEIPVTFASLNAEEEEGDEEEEDEEEEDEEVEDEEVEDEEEGGEADELTPLELSRAFPPPPPASEVQEQIDRQLAEDLYKEQFNFRTRRRSGSSRGPAAEVELNGVGL